jgi:teichuronic acid biosynthesis glycosyltransferase TuaC
MCSTAERQSSLRVRRPRSRRFPRRSCSAEVRILVVAKDFPTTAEPHAGIFVLRQAQALRDLGHELLVVRVVPHAPPFRDKWRAYRAIPEWDEVEGIRVRTIRALFLPRMLGAEYLPVQAARPLSQLAAAFAPDVVHAHFLIPSGQIAVRQPFSTLVTAHGSDAYEWAWRRPGLRKAAAEAARRAGCMVAVSDYIRQQVLKLANRPVEVVFNGADERIFAPSDRAAARDELGLAQDRFVIAFAGRASRAKGAFDLIEAAARLADARPIVLLAGTPPGAELQALIDAERVDARSYGLLPHEKLARVLAACDVFSLPSYHEGLPAAVCEAMLSGRAVVASAVGGIPEVIDDERSGFLVQPGDVTALARKLREAGGASVAARLGAAAYEFARTRLTWRVNALRHETLYLQARATTA